MSTIFSIREFPIRKSVIASEFAIKEDYKVIKDGETYSITATFGLDSMLNPTKPAVHTRNGYVPVLRSMDKTIPTLEVMEEFVKMKKGVYSLSVSTMLVCYFKGKYDGKNWSEDSVCDFFLPCDITDGVLKALRLSPTSAVGCVPFMQLDQLRAKIFNLVETSYSSKAEFLLSRLI